METFELEFVEPEPEKGTGNIAFDYFMDSLAPMPDKKTLDSWPLKFAAFVMSYKNVPSKRTSSLQPEFTKHIETVTHFPISPRKYIAFSKCVGKEFMFCDNFEFHCIRTLTQVK